MSDIDDLRLRLEDAERRFGLKLDEAPEDGARLVHLADAVIGNLSENRWRNERLAHENEEFRSMLMTLLTTVEKADRAELSTVLSEIADRLTSLIEAGAAAPSYEPVPPPDPPPTPEPEPAPQESAEGEVQSAAPISAAEAEHEFLDALTAEELALGEDIMSPEVEQPALDAAEIESVTDVNHPSEAEAEFGRPVDDSETAELHTLLDDIRRAIGLLEDETDDTDLKVVPE